MKLVVAKIMMTIRHDSIPRIPSALQVTLLLLLLCYGTIASAAKTLPDYRLGSGDKIKITVYDEPDLSMEVTLSESSTISYPFLGNVKVAGLTIEQLESELTKGLKDGYLVKPEVTVSIEQYRQFYIHGEVKKPGGFPYVPGITLRKAIALAGGFTERASHSKIYVIHDDSKASDVRELMKMDQEVHPGDTITVDQSFF